MKNFRIFFTTSFLALIATQTNAQEVERIILGERFLSLDKVLEVYTQVESQVLFENGDVYFRSQNAFNTTEMQAWTSALSKSLISLLADSGKRIGHSCFSRGVDLLSDQAWRPFQNELYWEILRRNKKDTLSSIEFYFNKVHRQDGEASFLVRPSVGYYQHSKAQWPHFAFAVSYELNENLPLFSVNMLAAQLTLSFLYSLGFPIDTNENNDSEVLEAAASIVVRCLLDEQSSNEASGFEVSKPIRNLTLEEITQ